MRPMAGRRPMQAARRALGTDVPNALQLPADEVID
jgi:hypothetical protein